MDNPNRTRTVDDHPAQEAAGEDSSALPRRIGRYRVEKVLGHGGFGLVFLAHDDQLQRLVAIKVPHRKLVSRPEEAEAYLTEARTVANLDHPNIVPVHDVGSTADYPCFIVSKFIEGSTLSKKIKEERLSIGSSAEMVATIAEALHYAHRKGLVHRDIKPGNIIIDNSGKPFVVDFGLALKEENVGQGPTHAGTPAYMSPEQARGEGHRVDGRSDIFSLGVVFYELLVGRQPFRADSQADQREQITSYEPRPPRQLDDSVPKELDRICLKALAKRASERYSAAKDMADDLRQFLAENTVQQHLSPSTRTGGSPSAAAAMPPSSIAMAASRSDISAATPNTPTSDSQPVKIVPKGLRSFDAQDADFFLELLPGPRDRNGLPDSLRFWKARIEEKEAEKTFTVGLICGPSGCGKSSLVKAGLLPRLADDVLAVYLEATADETETRLLKSLRKHFPGSAAVAHAPGSPLKETLAALRRGQGVPAGKKVLIVLDQFEQWLHAKTDVENTDLVQALRQCDGGRVQCIVMVRDDFWMAVIRFMRELENRLVEGHNSAAVDLFPVRHAEKVLAAFGRAFGDLPDSSTAIGKEQKQFVEQAIAGLAQDGKVICVRLALFAEMIKGKPWTPATLKAVGGTEGVGVTFLEETFSAASAPPEHRYHQKAARAVLNALLPESGTDIKGHMRSHAELLAASGYASRPRDFNDLIRILDSEIRLITPTDPEGSDDGGKPEGQNEGGYFQLTHDYMVPSLRNWLTRKQKESKRGRAELLLADRAAVWNGRPENRQLPSLGQWLSIRWWTQKKNWTPPQRKMMRKASRYHAVRGLALAVLLLVGTLGGLGIRDLVIEHNAAHAAGLVQSLASADIANVPEIIKEIEGYRVWADPLLRDALTQAQKKSDPRKQLHASLALLPVDPSQKDYLYNRLLNAAPAEVPVLRDALAGHQEALLDKLWAVAQKPAQGREQQRLRAACALATYDPDSQRWEKVQDQVVSDLITVPAVYLATWQDFLHPVRGKLLAPLEVVCRDANRLDSERIPAAKVLADYAADNCDLLADLLLDAEPKQFAVLYPSVQNYGERGRDLLTGELDKKLLPREMDWKVRFYAWHKAGVNQPPADWEAVLKSPVLDEVNMARLYFDTNTGLPTAKVPKVYFAAVATCEVTLVKSSNAFKVTYDDGVRVWLDDKVVFEDWKPNGTRSKSIQVTTQTGLHAIKVEYFQIELDYILTFEEDQAPLAKRQANAAAALLRMNDPSRVWPMLRHSPDPWVRSYLIDRLGPLGADAGRLVKRLEIEPDVTIKRALILSLGEFAEGQMTAPERSMLIEKLCALYEADPDAGLHGAAAWLLRQWGQGAKLKALDDKLHANEDQLYQVLMARLTKEQRQVLSNLAAKTVNLQNQIADCDNNLKEKQAAWEQQLRGQPPISLPEGLIAHFPLDEQEGKETANLVKGQPPGTYKGTGKPTWVPGVVHGALRLNGNGSIDCGTDLQLERTDAMSYGCWFFKQPGSGRVCLVGKFTNEQQQRGYAIGVDLNGTVIAEWTNEYPKNTLIVRANVKELTGRWHHLFVTYDGSSSAAGVRIYLDGRLAPMFVEEDTLSETIRNTIPLKIGTRDTAFLFRGDIDDVRIYNRRLADKEVTLIYEAGIQSLAGVSSQERTLELQKLLADHFRAGNEPFQKLLKEVAEVQALQRKLEGDTARDSLRRWYVNGQGQTLVVIPGLVEFLMGSPLSEDNRGIRENQHTRRIDRTFAIAAQPVTKEQFLRYLPKFTHNEMRRYPEATCPIGGVTWFEAAAYCNWLSKQEGIAPEQWCYEIGLQGGVTKLKKNYLSLTGYRLPTEAEMEYATRAGAVTSRYYGESEELLGKYGWFLRNSEDRTWPVGSKKPNDLGLFDMHGSIWCWCQDAIAVYPQGAGKTLEDKEQDTVINPQVARVVRGGSFFNPATITRSAMRGDWLPANRSIFIGFRVARTFPGVTARPLPALLAK